MSDEQTSCILQNQIEIMGALTLLLRYVKPDLIGKAGELDRQRDDLLHRHKATQCTLAAVSSTEQNIPAAQALRSLPVQSGADAGVRKALEHLKELVEKAPMLFSGAVRDNRVAGALNVTWGDLLALSSLSEGNTEDMARLAESESIYGLIRRMQARASDGRYYHFEEEDREKAIGYLRKYALWEKRARSGN